MQTILGASGVIGVTLARELKAYTPNIRLVSRNPKKVNDTDLLFTADITNRQQVFDAVKGSEIVYLVAGLSYKTKVWQEQWPLIMQNVIDASSEYNCRFVFFDNIYMIGGDNVKHITENSPFSPTSRKGKVRAQLDRMILDKIEQGKLNATIARCADYYGATGSNSVLMELVYKNLAKNKRAQWLFNARVRHSFTYVPDAAKGTAMLGNTKEAYNQIWNLPTHGNAMTGEDWIRLFANEMRKPDKFTVVPAWMVSIAGLFVPVMKELYEMRYQFNREYFFDSQKFEKYFGFRATPPDAAVREILAT